MPKTILILLIIFNINLFCQTDNKEFAEHINKSIYSFNKINVEKYNAIRGILIEFNSKYKISSYCLIFNNNDITLNENEYAYLLKKLNRKPFKKYIKSLHENEEYDKKENLKYKLKYIEPR